MQQLVSIFITDGDNRNSNSQMVKNATSQLTCKICWEAVVGIIFLPCSHLVCCVQCSAAMTQCPVCRTRVAGTIKVNIWSYVMYKCQYSSSFSWNIHSIPYIIHFVLYTFVINFTNTILKKGTNPLPELYTCGVSQNQYKTEHNMYEEVVKCKKYVNVHITIR